MLKINRTCNGCSRDLTQDNGADAYYIEIRSLPLPKREGARRAILIHPELSEPLHFCCMRCAYQHLNEQAGT